MPTRDHCSDCPHKKPRHDAIDWVYCRKFRVELQEWRTQFGDRHVFRCRECREPDVVTIKLDEKDLEELKRMADEMSTYRTAIIEPAFSDDATRNAAREIVRYGHSCDPPCKQLVTTCEECSNDWCREKEQGHVASIIRRHLNT